MTICTAQPDEAFSTSRNATDPAEMTRAGSPVSQRDQSRSSWSRASPPLRAGRRRRASGWLRGPKDRYGPASTRPGCCAGCQPVVMECFLDAETVRSSDASVDRKCLPQVGAAFLEVVIVQVTAADAFKGACFLKRRADIAGDGERLGVLVAGLAGGGGPRG